MVATIENSALLRRALYSDVQRALALFSPVGVLGSLKIRRDSTIAHVVVSLLRED